MRPRGDLAAPANDADDDASAARSHPLHQRVNDIDVGKELGVESRAPDLGRQFVRRRSSGRTGGIDEDVDRADAALDRLDHRAGLGGVGEIGCDAERVFQFEPRPLDIVARPRANGDPRPFSGEAVRAGESDAFRPAGDENNLAFETELHGTRLIAPVTRPAYPSTCI
jgi:hypothetical protein